MKINAGRVMSVKNSRSLAGMDRSNIKSSLKVLAVCILTVVSLCACSVGQSTDTRWASRLAKSWLKDGSITIARPLPLVTASGDQSAPGSSPLGFFPVNAALTKSSWILLDHNNSTLKLMDGEQVINSVSVEGIEGIPVGKYSVMLKQRNPLWYAPDSYFDSRELPNPEEGSKERFRRGALGDFVLYLDQNTPIHSGPIWSPEVGGARVSDQDLTRIYYLLDVGSYVEVR